MDAGKFCPSFLALHGTALVSGCSGNKAKHRLSSHGFFPGGFVDKSHK